MRQQYDGRFVCIYCGRAALPPDYALLYPASDREVWEGKLRYYYEALEYRQGRLWGHHVEECINGHRWEAPKETLEE